MRFFDYFSPLSWFAHNTKPGEKYIAPALDFVTEENSALKAVSNVLNAPYHATFGQLMPDKFNEIHDGLLPKSIVDGALVVVPSAGNIRRAMMTEKAAIKLLASKVTAAEGGLTALSMMEPEEPEEQDDALDQQKITQKSRKRLKTEGEFFVTKV